MKVKEVIKILTLFNEWRRGAQTVQPNPTTIGLAIDSAIKHLKKQIEQHNGKTDI